MSNNSTKINPDVSDGRTVVNMDVAGSSDTVINSDVHSDEQNFTVVNPAVQNYTIEIPEGMKDLSLRELVKQNGGISEVALEQLEASIRLLQEK